MNFFHNDHSPYTALQYIFQNDLVLARIDCENQPDVCQRYNVNKYPTLKVFRNGQVGHSVLQVILYCRSSCIVGSQVFYPAVNGKICLVKLLIKTISANLIHCHNLPTPPEVVLHIVPIAVLGDCVKTGILYVIPVINYSYK